MWRNRASYLRSFLLLVLLLSNPAKAADADEAVVRTFTNALETVMQGDRVHRYAGIVRLLRRHFDIAGISAKAMPDRIRLVATPQQVARFRETVLCRLAIEADNRRPEDKPLNGAVVGTRDASEGVVVAIRFALPKNRQRTVQFTIVARNGKRLIGDIRSENGRLTTRLAEGIRRDTRAVIGSDVEVWLRASACPR